MSDASYAWLEDAACRGLDPEIMHPRRGDMSGLAKARAVCASCPVREPCLEDALNQRADDQGTDIGVRAGTSGRERRALRARRNREARAAARKTGKRAS